MIIYIKIKIFCDLIIISIDMTLASKLKSLIKGSDFFYSTQMLRFDAQLQYKTLTGGIISLGIIITIIIGFASMIKGTLNLSSITSSVQKVRNSIPPPTTLEITPDSNFRFAVEIWGFNLSDSVRYFDVTFWSDLAIDMESSNITQLPLQACTIEMFQHFPEITENFYNLNVSSWLCPPMNTTLHLQGKYSSPYYQQYYVQVSACNNQTDPLRPCASPQEIDAFFAANKQMFYFDFYFTNPQINPDKQNYKNVYLQDKSYAIFGRNIGSETYLYFTDYSIQTDYSIWPFSNVLEDNGCIVENLAINHPSQTNINGTYITWNLAKSSDSIIYTRNVQKISSVFSFIGGMIGAISAALFFFKLYTSLSFQFSIAFQIFKPKEAGEQNSHISMNLFNFIKYYIFIISKAIGRPCNWYTMKYAYECKRQILKQLDVKALIKRIIFIEYCLTNTIQDYQLNALQLKRPTDPKFVKQIRQKCQSIIGHSIQDQSESQSDGLSQIQEIKQENNIEKSPNTGSLMFADNINQTPEGYSYPSSLIEKQRIQLKQMDQRTAKYSDNIVAVEKESMRSESKDDSMNALQRKVDMKPLRQLGSINSYQLQKRASLMLVQLRRNAMNGNVVSNRIWKALDKQTKMKIENGSFIQQK